jgi:hypothetical protein
VRNWSAVRTCTNHRCDALSAVKSAKSAWTTATPPMHARCRVRESHAVGGNSHV